MVSNGYHQGRVATVASIIYRTAGTRWFPGYYYGKPMYFQINQSRVATVISIIIIIIMRYYTWQEEVADFLVKHKLRLDEEKEVFKNRLTEIYNNHNRVTRS